MNPDSPPRPLPTCPPDPPESHHITACLPQLQTGHALNNTPGRWWKIFRSGQCIHHLHRYMATRAWAIGIGAETYLGSDFTRITSWMSSSATGCGMRGQDCAELEEGGGILGQGYWVERNWILIICWALDVSVVHEVKNTLEISELHTLRVR